MCRNKDVLVIMPPFAPPSGRGLTKGTCEVFWGKPNGHMRMLTGASRRLAKRHSATVRSPAPSHTYDIHMHVQQKLNTVIQHDAACIRFDFQFQFQVLRMPKELVPTMAVSSYA